ncbi:MAG: helix-turn-helix domain-containing protein [Thermodesulfobacteriota bacterium]|jgi:predicted site-specific integrase-resolvase
MSDRWLRMGEACRKASLSRPTMRKYCEDGLIEGRKLPGRRGDWRIREASIEAFMAPNNDARAFALEHLESIGL